MQIMIADSGRALLDRDSKHQESWLSQAMSGILTEREQELLREAARLLDRLADMSSPQEEGDA